MRRICLREQALLTNDKRNEQPKKEAHTNFELTNAARSRTAFALPSNGLRVLTGGTNGLHAYFFVAFPAVLVAILFFPVSFLAPVFFAARLLPAAFWDFFAGLFEAFAAMDDCLPVDCFLDRCLTFSRAFLMTCSTLRAWSCGGVPGMSCVDSGSRCSAISSWCW